MGIAEVEAFITKWQRSTLKERSASQEHFLDLCRLLGEKTPAEADPEGAWYCFEAGAKKLGGGDGWADVWKRGFFAWEYKGKKKDLVEAYLQLNEYREDLENPPLLVVCDTDRFEVHTNFTGTAVKVHAFALDDLRDPETRRILQAVFRDPSKLRPRETPKTVTEEAAAKVAGLAIALEKRGIEPARAAHFLMQIIFCMFAEDIGILAGKLLSKLLDATRDDPQSFESLARQLFVAMKDGGHLGLDPVPWFNGGLFINGDVIALTADELNMLQAAARLDWSGVEPAIFGTLFERSLDPGKRGQTGAHYTSPEDIMLILEPVILAPLRREWTQAKERAEQALERAAKTTDPAARTKAENVARREVGSFLDSLRSMKVLDPACGSGNFLYLALRALKNLEGEGIAFSSHHGLGDNLPFVSPSQLYGIEVNPYAHELAQVVVWIGHLQWNYQNAYTNPERPVLKKFDNIRHGDAILADDPSNPRPPWPDVDFIIGNPPFLGGKLLRSQLTSAYVDRLFAAYDGRVPREADLCCYWFERARELIASEKVKRAGLLATQGIRGGVNRVVLQRIKEGGDIFFAESDRDWVLDGADVHVSMVGFDNGTEQARTLDGNAVKTIHTNLSSSRADVTLAHRLKANAGLAFMGDSKGGKFDIDEETALEMLRAPNPHGLPNSDVIVPWANGQGLKRRIKPQFIIDFGSKLDESQSAKYELPFAHVVAKVKHSRAKNNRELYAKFWWRHVEPRPGMIAKLTPLPRFIGTVRHTKHRLFFWMQAPTLPDSAMFAFASPEDWFFGILHSRVHEVWARAQATQVRERESGLRYTPSSCFETFPFPSATGPQREAIALAARELNDLRERWLNPPEWTRERILEFPGTPNGPWSRYLQAPLEGGVGTIRYPLLEPRDDDCAVKLKTRTLTHLYNQQPAWLQLAHEKLDAAVANAYGWPPNLDAEGVCEGLLALNLADASTNEGQLRLTQRPRTTELVSEKRARRPKHARTASSPPF